MDSAHYISSGKSVSQIANYSERSFIYVEKISARDGDNVADSDLVVEIFQSYDIT